jgi:threonine/homoserine/homoserine lactone efflux protein
LFIWFLPILIIATSDKTTGSEKLAWILAIVFLSWFAWIFYFLLAPLKRKSYYRDYRYYRYD